MSVFCYYAFCTVKNQLRRLLKTWVAVFLLICLLFGVLIGLGASLLEDAMGDEVPGEDEIIDELPEEPWTEEDAAAALGYAELVIGGLCLALFCWEILAADKNGSLVFLPADVNLLFPSPMHPQSVLLFRLMTQLGGMLLAGLYLLFQMPGLAGELGLSPLAGFFLALAFALLLALSKLLHVLFYTLGATHPQVRRGIRPALLGLLLVAGVGFYLTWQGRGAGSDPLAAALAYFNAPLSRLIPLWGWLKGMCLYSIEGNYTAAALSLGALLLVGAGLVWVIWHLKADFYEDAMAKTAETEAATQAATEGGAVMAPRKKDRPSRLRRDGLRHGRGANAYFFKAMYNRFRFAHFHVLTRTAETYLLVGAGLSCLLRFAAETREANIVMLVLGAMVFFRSLGDPLAEDIERESFFLVPEPAHAKLFYSMLAGLLQCVMDLLPAVLVTGVILMADPLALLGWLALIVTVDWYATNVIVFIGLSLPTSLDKTIRTLIAILFIYFGLLPDVALLAVGLVLGPLPLFAALAAALNLLVGAVVFAFSPLFIEHGRR